MAALAAGGGNANSAPLVDAGTDATIRLPTDSVALDGTVSDDGLPIPVPVTTWSGPPGVGFADPGAVDTTATLPGPGTYLLELAADDTEFQTSDTVTVIVEAANVNSRHHRRRPDRQVSRLHARIIFPEVPASSWARRSWLASCWLPIE